MTMRTFWMVKGPGPTSVRHDSLAAAEHEAKRLARLNHDVEFVVLQAVTGFMKRDVDRIEVADPDFEQVPF